MKSFSPSIVFFFQRPKLFHYPFFSKSASIFLWLYLLILSLGINGPVFSQHYSYINYTTAEGLPTNETYHIFQIKNNHLLIASDHGLISYDGSTFKQLPFSDQNLNGATVFQIKEGPDKKIWLSSYRHGLFYLHDDTLRPHPFNHIILNVTEQDFISDFELDQNNCLWFVTKTLNHTESPIAFYKIDIDGKLSTYPATNFAKENNYTYLALPIREKYALISHNIRPQTTEPHENGSGHIDHLDSGWGLKGANISGKALTLLTNEGCWMAANQTLYFASHDRKRQWHKKLESEILYLYENEGGLIFTGTRNGVYIIKDFRILQKLLPGNKVSGIYQDHEGGYWFATTDQGIFYLPSLHIWELNHAAFTTHEISGIGSNSRYLGVTTLQNVISLFHVTGDGIKWRADFPLFTKDSKEIWLSETTLYQQQAYTSLSDPSISKQLLSKVGMEHDMHVIGDSIILKAGKSGVALFHRETPYNNFEQEGFNYHTKFTTAVHMVGDTLFSGTDHGVFANLRNNDRLFRPFPQLPELHITDIASLTRNTLLISTKSNGIYVINLKNGEIIAGLNEELGLSSNYCSRLLIENDSVFWAGTNNGLNRIVRNKDQISIAAYYSSDGLQSNKVNDLAMVQGWLFASSTYGISYFRMDSMTGSPHKMKAIIKEVLSEGSVVPVQQVMTFKPGAPYVRFEFDAPTFRKRQALSYEYRLRELDNEWNEALGAFASFDHLNPGIYTLDVRPLLNSTPSHMDYTSYSLEFQPYFYETTWFRFLFIGSVFLIFALAIYFFFQQKEQKRKQVWDISIARLSALSLQMNPHFLYNSLHTIQQLAHTSRHNLLLSRFVNNLSRLTRNVLENSRQLLVPLETELENVESYIKLEQHWFEEKSFDYNLTVDPSLNSKRQFIPPLLLQPIVENALWHGLFPKETGQRLLKVACQSTKDGFSIHVSDNGVGRKNIQPRKMENKNISIGIENTHARLALYKQMGFGTADLITIDLSGEDEISHGTEVIFEFKPKKIKTNDTSRSFS